MSAGRRAYDILRSYVHGEWDRIRSDDHSRALEELDTISPRESSEETVTRVVTTDKLPQEEQIALARKILGVSADAGFKEIRGKFEILNLRSDPAQFPDQSTEQAEAESIRRRLYWAYRKLTEGYSESEKRFRSLEID